MEKDCVEIIYEPDEVWGLFMQEKDSIGEEFPLAYDDGGIEIVMIPNICNDYLDEEVFPYIVTKFLNDEMLVEVCINEKDCIATVKDAYECLGENSIPIYSDEDYPSESNIDDKIEDREDELYEAVEEFLAIVVDDSRDFDLYVDDETVRKLKDKFLAFIDREGIPVYRPAMVTGPGGEIIYTEYPYRLLRDE